MTDRSDFCFQLFQCDAVFLQEVDQHTSMAQQFRVLGREMLHDMFNVFITAHRRIELLLSLKFRLSSEHVLSYHCLLYTSDAADEEDSVDLGGRRIIKKKKKN